MTTRLKIWAIWLYFRWRCRQRARLDAHLLHPLIAVRIALGDPDPEIECACGRQATMMRSDRDVPYLTVNHEWASTGNGGHVRLVRSYTLVNGPMPAPLNVACWFKHSWQYAAPVRHWLSAGGELRAFDLGMKSCQRDCRRCHKAERLDDCTFVAIHGGDMFGAYKGEKSRMVVTPGPPRPERRIKA